MAAAVHAACACVGGLAVWAGGERKEPEDDNAHSDTYPHAAPKIGLHTCLQAVVYSMTCFSLNVPRAGGLHAEFPEAASQAN